ncbi:hypothetical protein M407DRAFT_22039 [Tulasnella calospora MUT 4182]|uniref:BTB domain-containing protein n=1 Tax=Tulasnella calospora MUT 4182 TaxID=1051891 RepID=A0A0C3QM14_9AGAM|nr:hypothetical protein M407DRAFT_22039 [Tulasnella calospora MUT 4182]
MTELSNIPHALKGLNSVVVHPDFKFPDADVVLSVTGRCLYEKQLLVDTDIRSNHSESGGASTSDDDEDFHSQTSRDRRKEREEKNNPEKPSQATLFKVHKSVLRRASEFFADMFSIPQPSNQDTIDGLPIIYMHDDPIDIHNFINHIYNSDVLHYLPLRQSTFNMMSSIIRLSRKYLLLRLAPAAMFRIRSDWPTTLEEWDKNDLQVVAITRWNAQVRDGSQDGGSRLGPEDLLVEPCRVIRFARQENILEILPAAFYHLSRLSSLNDPHRPRSCIEGRKRAHGYWMGGGRYATRSVLTPADWDTLMIGKAEIRAWFVNFRQYGWQSIHATNCGADDPSSCVLSSQGGWKNYWDEVIGVQTRKILAQDGLDVMEVLQVLRHVVLYDENLCSGCRVQAGKIVGCARTEFWDCLPDFFRLKRPNPWGGIWMEGEPVDCFEQSI